MELKIRVVAAIDRSLSNAYRPFEESAKRATKLAASEGQKAGEAVSRGLKKGTDATEKEFKKVEKAAERYHRQMVREAEASMRAQVRANEQVAREFKKVVAAEDRELQKQVAAHERAEAKKTRATEREAARRNREIERTGKAEARAQQRSSQHFNGALVTGGAAAGRAAMGVARSLATGAGVNLDLGSHVASGVDLEKRAVDLANAGYMPGHAGAAGQRQSASALESEMRDTATRTGASSGTVAEGMQAFVGKTGDLETGRAIMFDMAKLSKATGASMEDMLDAAGDVANALGDTDNKGEKVKSVMAAIAAQGKEGAVEIKDLAKQMAKLGASSGAFSGDHSAVMAQMGALAQMSRAKGGSASATQAATSVLSFTNTFDKSAREKAFKGFHVNTRDDTGKLRSPIDIIVDSIRSASSASHGGMGSFSSNMGKMFMDARARSATRGFETIYKDAGGGEEGIRKVREAFDELAGSVMKNKEINDSFANAMATDAAKAAVLNEQLDAAAKDIRTALLPALAEFGTALAPIAKDFAGVLGDLLGVKREKASKETVAADLSGTNALGHLMAVQRQGRTGKVGADDLDAALSEGAAARKALETQIASKGAEVQKAGQFKYGGLDLGKRLDEMSPEELAKASSEGASYGRGGDAQAKKYLEDKQALDRMKATLEGINRSTDSIADGIAQKTLKVMIVGDTRPPELGGYGVTPPPGQKPK